MVIGEVQVPFSPPLNPPPPPPPPYTHICSKVLQKRLYLFKFFLATNRRKQILDDVRLTSASHTLLQEAKPMRRRVILTKTLARVDAYDRAAHALREAQGDEFQCQGVIKRASTNKITVMKADGCGKVRGVASRDRPSRL